MELTRQTIPKDMPLFLRISATDWLEDEPSIPESWRLEDTVRLAEVIAGMGVDLLDVSSGGLHPKQKVKTGPGYQAPFAKAVKEKLGDKLAVATVGSITSGKQANELLEEGLDLTIAGRMFQKSPALVWQFAEELGVQINVANQIRWSVPLYSPHLETILSLQIWSESFLLLKHVSTINFLPYKRTKLTRNNYRGFGGRPGAPEKQKM